MPDSVEGVPRAVLGAFKEGAVELADFLINKRLKPRCLIGVTHQNVAMPARRFLNFRVMSGIPEEVVDREKARRIDQGYGKTKRARSGIPRGPLCFCYQSYEAFIISRRPCGVRPRVGISREDEVHIKVTDQPLNPQELIEHVRQDEAGAVVLFSGVVRNHNLGRKVECLEYEAYPEMAEKVMREIAHAMRNEWQVTDIAIQHRTGRLEIGEASLLVAVSSPHRREAFEVASALVDRFKETVPVWKKEVFEAGEEWLEGDRRAPEH